MDESIPTLRFSQLPTAARVLWAKSGETTGHGLLAHLLDVAAVVETMLEIEPKTSTGWASTRFGLPVDVVTRWLAAIAGLHDFGKAIPGFQAKWPEGMQGDEDAGLAFPPIACSVEAHSCATAALLGKPLTTVSATEAGWVRHAVQAISAHHGYHFLLDEVNMAVPRGEPRPWADARHAILRTYWNVLSPIGIPTRDELSLPEVNWLAGMTSAADWIASNPEWFPLGERHDDLTAYYADARNRAARALEEIGWSKAFILLDSPSDTDRLLARIMGHAASSVRPLQQVGDALLHGVKGPALLLVEAPMGEGKTELAFLAYLRLQAANSHRGLYLALPTQATGNALFRRALTFLRQFASGPLDVQLVHGGAGMNEEIRHLRGIANDPQESLSASAWFAQRKRPLLSPYGVGTIDQALFAVLNVKHHFVRLWGLANRVVVLDEVHAYDTYTNGLIVVLLRWLRALGCSVVLMSATLPQARRNELLRAWGVGEFELPELDYPRLLLADNGGVRGERFAARPLAPVHLSSVAEGVESLADVAIEQLAGGGCGALIVNTVDRAQRLYLHLRDRLGDAADLQLFHARFPADERAACERQVLASFGTGGERPARALLIATQVAEQSLDIDFDFMLSDLAPVDLLLQRAGRLHRHERCRPARHRQARLWVAGLNREVLPELKDTAWGYVYDAYILLRTWALLRDEAVLDLPGDIDRLVQAVYSDAPLPDDLEAAARERIEVGSYGEYLAKVKNERLAAQHIAIDPTEEPQSAYLHRPRGNEEGEGTGLENRTRLGRESITLIPLEVVDGGWCLRRDEEPFSPDQPLPDGLARRLHDRQLKVSRTWLVKRLKCAVVPLAFQHPALRNCYPLPLQQGRYAQDGVHLRLDDKLGLVYEPADGANKEGA
ncbi:CRISPR-associated helicase Cas3' [Pseudoxanthomonas sp. CAU 1598]|uniref:CRISPR-associated helicase Cas3 n=2 Tax=Pseudomarimonas arenosa TaxID=2774145 RepID=A0AAW3ZNY7_9GAMM|nr:CRISPR-associated helicase Cas3' [Pseudomarimonas arenosa]MBD8525981.1 CRISPR-associated helicase Cas3' [Pseudomarimonas arenosa]